MADPIDIQGLIDDVIGNAPAAESDAPLPIGVPEGFRTERSTDTGFRSRGNISDAERFGVEARYFAGDEMEMTGWSTQQTAAWQQAMSDANILTGKYTHGLPDDKTLNAYFDVLSIANRTGKTADQALLALLQGNAQFGEPSGGGGGGGGRAPFRARLSNPDDIRKAFDGVLRSQTGVGGADPEIVDRMVAAYHEVERGSQRQAHDGSGDVTDAPSFETFAEKFIDEQSPGGRAAKTYADAAQAMMQAMGAPI